MEPISSLRVGKPAKKKRISIIMPTMDAGGAERQLSYLLRGLDRDKFALHLVVLKAGGIFEKDIPADISTLFISNYKCLFKSLRQIYRYLRDNNIEIVHSILPTSNFFATFLKLLMGKKITLISSQQGIHYKYFNKWTIFDLVAHRLADMVIVNSETVKINCVELLKIRPTKIRIIPNGVKDEYFRIKYDAREKERMGLDKGIPVVLSVGRFDKLKGHQILVESAIALLTKGLQFYLVIVGAGPTQDELSQLIERKGFLQYIIFPGKTDNVIKYLKIADIFTLATFSEGLPNVILEAMAAGLPVITTSIPANRELIENGKEGILVPAGDPSAFAEAMKRMVEKYEEAKKMGKRGAKKVKEQFSIEKMVERYNELYLEGKLNEDSKHHPGGQNRRSPA